jgi:hypothetical protein
VRSASSTTCRIASSLTFGSFGEPGTVEENGIMVVVIARRLRWRTRTTTRLSFHRAAEQRPRQSLGLRPTDRLVRLSHRSQGISCTTGGDSPGRARPIGIADGDKSQPGEGRPSDATTIIGRSAVTVPRSDRRGRPCAVRAGRLSCGARTARHERPDRAR